MAESSDTLNVVALDLPSDRITMGQVRRSQPNLFDTYHESSEHEISMLNIAATIATELILARNAYAKAKGLPPFQPMDHKERRREIDGLDADYGQFGISTGPKQTFELIRKLERDAANQAKQPGK
jgi:hypothetical protein